MSWLPAFACPECGSPLVVATDSRLTCSICGRAFERRECVWRLLSPARQQQLEQFARQYRLVREQEGRRRENADYYRLLPAVPPDDPHARDWRVRQETYRHLLGHVFAAARQPSTVLDVGAGSAWLSNRLASLGHRVVAVDAIEDEADGLGAVRYYETPIVAVQADFDALPFVAGQFDIVVFNGSLHYAADPHRTLSRAHTMLAEGGTLVVMDSPMFATDRDGAAMVDAAVRRIARQLGLQESVQPGCGYLTFSSLDKAASMLRLVSAFVPSRGSLWWRVCRRIARMRMGRQPASFGLWMAR
jgi:SAM-dependent methyltransferase